jgi:hypothetical protein
MKDSSDKWNVTMEIEHQINEYFKFRNAEMCYIV